VSGATSCIALAAAKIQVDSPKDYVAEFQSKNGTTARTIVEKLAERHVMVCALALHISFASYLVSFCAICQCRAH
jgi:hypothetical protein